MNSRLVLALIAAFAIGRSVSAVEVVIPSPLPAEQARAEELRVLNGAYLARVWSFELSFSRTGSRYLGNWNYQWLYGSFAQPVVFVSGISDFVLDPGFGYNVSQPNVRVVSSAGGGAAIRAYRFQSADSRLAFDGIGKIVIVDPGFTYTDDAMVVIDPPRLNDFQYAITNPAVTSIRLQSGRYYQNAVIDRDLIIRGEGIGKTIASGALLGSVFTIRPGVTVTLEDMSIVDGLAPSGGGIFNDGNLTVVRCEIANNRAYKYLTGEGGGIFNRGGAKLTVRDSIIRDNVAARDGGGISSSGFNLSRLPSPGGSGTSSNLLASTFTDLQEIDIPSDPTDTNQQAALEEQVTGILAQQVQSFGSPKDFFENTFNDALADITGWLALGSPVCIISNTVITGNRVGAATAVASMDFMGNTVPRLPRLMCFGGGVHNDLGLLTIQDSEVGGNTVESDLGNFGGAVSSMLGGLKITNSKLNNNLLDTTTFVAMGGAVYSFGSYTRISDSQMNSNRVKALFLSSGGALKNTAVSFSEITRCELNDNTSGGGGGIANDFYGVLQVTDSSVMRNSISGVIAANGGGIRNEAGGQSVIKGSTISENVVKGKAKGGGVYNECTQKKVADIPVILASTMTLQNCTISGNVVDGNGTFGIPLIASGAGVYNGSVLKGVANTYISSCTIVSNRAFNGIFNNGGGIKATPFSELQTSRSNNIPGISLVQLANTIVAHNQPEDLDNTLPSLIVTLGYNIDTDGSGVTAALLSELVLPFDAQIKTVSDARLSPLQNNGGRTRTHALLPLSPAIDSGAPAGTFAGDISPSTDQRGVARTFGVRQDVGAFESAPPLSTGEGYQTFEDQPLVVNAASGVLVNDYAAAMTAQVLTNPANGSLALAADGSFTYVPATNFTGTNRFVYRVADAYGAFSSNATATIFVRPRLDLLSMTPVTNSLVERYTDIFLRFDEPVSSAAIQANVTITGSASGPKGFTVTVSGTNVTLNPITDFLVGETVTVVLRPTLASTNGSPLHPGVTNRFFIYPNRPPLPGPAEVFAVAEDGFLQQQLPLSLTNNDVDLDGDSFRVLNRETVPVGYIQGWALHVADSNNVSEPFYVGNWPNGTYAVLASVSASHGQLNLSTNGTFTYRPATNYSGTDSFKYVLTDGQLESDPITVTINVTPVNDVPLPSPDLYSIDTTVVTAGEGVLANDVDIDTPNLQALLATPPSHGTVLLSPNGSFTYTRAVDWNGADAFTYRVTDSTSTSAPVQVKIGNTPPVAVLDHYAAPLGATFTVTNALIGLLANDVDPDGDTQFTAALEATSTNATVVLNPDGTFTYTPNPGFSAPDVFFYRVNDGIESSEVGRVKIGNTPPVGVNDPNYFVSSGATLNLPSAQGVLTNDYDLEGDTLTADLVSSTTHGSLALQANGGFTYTPAPGYLGSDSFTYRVFDGVTNSTLVTVTISIVDALRITGLSPRPHSASASSNSPIQLSFNMPIDAATLAGRLVLNGSLSGKRSFSTSVSSNVVTLTPSGAFKPGESVSIAMLAGIQSTNFFRLPENFAWQFFSRAPRGGARFTQSTPNTNLFAARGVAVGDLNGDGRIDAVIQNSGAAAQLLFNTGGGVFTNRAETLGMDWTFTIADQPLVADFNGDGFPDLFLNTGYSGRARVGLNNGTGAFSAVPFPSLNKSIQYSAAADFDGDGDVDIFCIGFTEVWLLINNGTGNFAIGRSVLIYPPVPSNFPLDVAVGDVDGDGDVDVYVSSFAGDKLLLNQNNGDFILSNDALDNRMNSSVALADVDGDSDLDVILGPNMQTPGRLWLNNGAGKFARSVYDVPGKAATDLVVRDFDGDADLDAFYGDPSDVASLNDGAGRFTSVGQGFGSNSGGSQGAADFDGDGDIDVMAVRSAQNGPTAIFYNQTLPFARDDFYTPNGNNPLSISSAFGVLTNDVAGDGGAFSSVLFSNALRGSVSLSANGSFTYTPNGSFTGTDVFLYRLVDSGQTSSVARVKIGNTAPVAVPDTNYFAVNDAQFAAVTPGVLGNDIDGENDPLTALLVSVPTNGTLVLRADGSFLYTAPSNFVGVVSFTYRATDGFATSAVTTVTLDVRTRLTLASMTPTANYTHAPADGGVTLRFNRPLNAATVATNVFLSGSFTGLRPVTRSVSGSTITIVPTNRFLPGEVITVTVRAGLEGASGERILAPLVSQFITEAPFSLGQFTDSGQRLGSNVTQMVALGDYDRDGDLDAFTGSRAPSTNNPGQAALILWLNNGQGQFTDSGQRLGDSATLNISRADLDGDGDLDIVADEVVYLNNGAGVFSAGTSLGSNIIGSVVGDLNGDARPDIVTWLITSGIIVWINNGNGTFTQNPASVADLNFASLSIFRASVADVDGDGTLDVITAPIQSGSPFRIWLNDGRGILRESGFNAGNGADFVAVGDLDANGSVDVLAANTASFGTAAYFAWLNRGDGLFSNNDQTNGFSDAGIGALADADGDGDLDAFLPQWTNSTRYNLSTVLLNNGLGQFAQSGIRFGDSTTDPTNASIGITLNRSLAVGDLNGDGALDIYFGVDQLGLPWANQVWFNSAALGPIEGGTALAINDTQTVSPFTNIVVRGPSNVVLTITVDDVAKGTFTPASLAAAGFTGPVGNTFTRASTHPTNAQAAIRQLVFAPTRNRLPIGTNELVSFTIIGNDGAVMRTNRLCSVLISPVNDAPIAVNDSGAGFIVSADGVLTLPSVLANDSDPDPGDTLTINNVNTRSLAGSITNLGNGVFRYTPAPGFAALRASEFTLETFSYTVRDPQNRSASAVVTIRVNGVNASPMATADSVRLLENSGLTVLTTKLLANDSDPDGGELSSLRIISVNTNGTRGRVQFDTTNGVSYNPTGYFTNQPDGTVNLDSFTYTIADTNGATATASVSLRIMNVNKPPVAVADTFTVVEGVSNTNLTAFVLANDYDPDPGETALLQIREIQTTGTIGSVTFSNSVLTYSAAGRFESLAAGQTTNDSFSYTLFNRISSRLAHTSVPIGSLVTDAFVDVRVEITDDGLFSLGLDGVTIYTNLLLPNFSVTANGRFAFGGRTGGLWQKSDIDDLSITLNGGTPTNVFYDFSSLTAGASLFGVAVLTNGVLQLTPPLLNQNGGWMSPAIVTNAVSGFVATFKMRMGSASVPPADGVSFMWGTDIPAGAVGEEGDGYGLVVSFDTYDNGNGEAPAIDVRWRNGISQAVVTATIVGQNDIPVAADDTIVVPEGRATNLTALLLANDTDVDNGEAATLVISGVSGATTNGVLSFTNGVVTFTPNANANLRVGQSVLDSFIYTVRDAQNATSNAIATIYIVGTNSSFRSVAAMRMIPETNVTARGEFAATPRALLTLESSTNLLDWQFHSVVFAPTSGLVQFIERNTTNPPMRFYRVQDLGAMPPGLISYWRADGDAFDSFGTNSGTLINGLNFTTGRLGSAFNFTGGNALVQIGASPVSVPWTATFWVNRQDASDISAALLSDANSAIKLEQAGAGRRVGITRYGFFDANVNYIVPTNTWTHLALVASGSSTIVYANGVQVGTMPNTISLPLGTFSRVGGDRMRAAVDEAAVFNRALSETEIWSLFNATSAP